MYNDTTDLSLEQRMMHVEDEIRRTAEITSETNKLLHKILENFRERG